MSRYHQYTNKSFLICTKSTFTKWNFIQVVKILHMRCLWCLWQISRLNFVGYSSFVSCSLIHTVLIIGVWCLTDIEFSSFWYCILKDCLFTFRITGCWVGVMRCGGNHLEVANGPQVTISDANSESWCSGLGPTSKKTNCASWQAQHLNLAFLSF